MIGEDFRSQALQNYHRVLELEDEVLRLRAELHRLKKAAAADAQCRPPEIPEEHGQSPASDCESSTTEKMDATLEQA